LLKEWDPETKSYTGREVSKKIKYVARFKINDLFWPREDIERYGLQVISLE